MHVPTDCGGHGPLLAAYERKLGFKSWSIVFAQSYLGYPADEVLGNRGFKNLISLELKRWMVFFRACKYDVISYNMGSSIAPNPVFVGLGLSSMWGKKLRFVYTVYSLLPQMWDVLFLRLLGKKIIVVFQGGDARQGGYLRDHFKWSDWNEEPKGYYTALTDLIKRFRIWLWGILAHQIYFLNPDHGYVLPKRAKFLPYVAEVKKMKQSAWEPGERLVLGHVVNHREPKGTRFVLDAVHKIRMQGKDFGFVFAERVPLKIALKLYEDIDVLLEQFVLSWYGLQAVEFMAMGKPVVVYVREADLKFVPKEMRDLPFFTVNDPKELDKLIVRILAMPKDKLKEKGIACRKWVEAHHDVSKLVDKLTKETYINGR